MKLKTTIGLEIHVQLKTQSKMFSAAKSASDEKNPNTHIDPVIMGHPGVLPVPNKKAILFALKIGKALGSKFPKQSKFDRKHYFYPDLPKGYQISQYDQPFCEGGSLTIMVGDEERKIRFNRVHLEEDAAKLTHTGKGASLVDYNRAGMPLAEMVTEPDLTSPEEAGIFLRELRTLMRYLGVSDADMEKGHMRCDANISVQNEDENTTTAIVEIKNLNSFRAVERALAYERDRLSELVEQGREKETIKETRGWSDKTSETTSQRSKEEASDYRYFPDPDLPPVLLNDELLGDPLLSLPELPWQKRERFEREFGLDHEGVLTICADPDLADFFERTTSELAAWLQAEGKEAETQKVYKLVSNWILAELLKHLRLHGSTVRDVKFSPENYAEFIKMVHLGRINSSAAQVVLEEMYETGADPTEVIKNKDLEQVSDAGALEEAVAKVIDANPEPVHDFQNGKEKALQFLIGQVMKEMKGKANPQMLKEIFERKLKS